MSSLDTSSSFAASYPRVEDHSQISAPPPNPSLASSAIAEWGTGYIVDDGALANAWRAGNADDDGALANAWGTGNADDDLALANAWGTGNNGHDGALANA
ncbi:hypothetical protein BDZ45DRAFT_749031 [Acephala macrosclerotiorum]|nr:hypothetical protein BDZ45DRAFT_749031 [Acephala macrosclerotiorum]